MNELHGIGIHDNTFKFIPNKSLDFGIVDWANGCSLVLVLEVELVVIDEPKIMYESVFESDEIAMLI
jgi:hypothetical protein